MNERIKLLAEQAGFIPDNAPGMNSVLEKFAELIVRECIEKITTYDLVPGHSAKWEDIYDIHLRSPTKIATGGPTRA